MPIFDTAVRLKERMTQLGQVIPALGARTARVAVASTPTHVIYRENKMQVLRFDTGAPVQHKIPVLMVPSLINRHYILDLMPEKSVAEALCNAGFAVTTVDWGKPADEDRYLGFERYIADYLHRAVEATMRETGATQVALLGYCLGGTMATGYAALEPQNVHSLLALTSPTDFTDSGLLSTWSRSPTFDVDMMVDAFGNVPWPLMQASFHMLRPTLSIAKAKGVLEKLNDDEFMDGFIALETWGNDNVSFPGACYRTFIEDLYRQNALARGKLRVGQRPVQLANITMPLLNIAAQHDNIVPLSSSHALMDLAGSADKTEWVIPGGHIGAIVSRRAMRKLWPAVTAWLLERV